VNRGGARFVFELFKVDADEEPLWDRLRVLKDVAVLDLKASDQVRLEPGESLTLAFDGAPRHSLAAISSSAPKYPPV
jgi:D-lyxose ketol-isomerase